MNTTTAVIPQDSVHEVPFHKHNLFLVEHEGQPFVPMRPIIEGMGLNWKSQYAKLNINKERWGCVVLITAQARDTKTRELISVPLTKMFGFICTIQPSSVKRKLRSAVVQFQDECDGVLWAYWNKNHKPTKKETFPQIPTVITTPKTPQNTNGINSIILSMLKACPKDEISAMLPELARYVGEEPTLPAPPDTVQVNAHSLKGTLGMSKLVKERSGELFAAHDGVKRSVQRLDRAMYRIHDVLMDLPMHTRGLCLDK